MEERGKSEGAKERVKVKSGWTKKEGIEDRDKVRAEKIIRGEIETREGASRYLRHRQDYYTNSSLTFEPYGFIPSTPSLALWSNLKVLLTDSEEILTKKPKLFLVLNHLYNLSLFFSFINNLFLLF